MYCVLRSAILLTISLCVRQHVLSEMPNLIPVVLNVSLPFPNSHKLISKASSLPNLGRPPLLLCSIMQITLCIKICKFIFQPDTLFRKNLISFNKSYLKPHEFVSKPIQIKQQFEYNNPTANGMIKVAKYTRTNYFCTYITL